MRAQYGVALRVPRWSAVFALACLLASQGTGGTSEQAGRESVASGGEGDVWEPHIAVVPGDASRLAVAVTQDAAKGGDLALSLTGGSAWTQVDIGAAYDTTVVADRAGSFWSSHVDVDQGCPPVVTRIAPGSLQPASQVRPAPPSPTATCDKPMIDIDIAPKSPSYGRLRLAWLDLVNGRLVLTVCDTRIDDRYEPSRCDSVENWATSTYPFAVGVPQLWGPDLGSGPDGKLFIVWNDRGSGTIYGTSCGAEVPVRCDPPSVVAATRHGLPCSIPSGGAPGRPISNSPSLDVDISDGPNRGSVFVTWTDLGSGTPCHSVGGLDPPPVNEATQDINAFIAVGKDRLPGPSDAVPVYRDGDEDSIRRKGASKSDEFYPTVSVDPETGQPWVVFYSSRLDETRRTNHAYIRRVDSEPNISLGPPQRISISSSGFDAQHANNYGEYIGLDVTCNWPFATWVGRGRGSDAVVYIPSQPLGRCGGKQLGAIDPSRPAVEDGPAPADPHGLAATGTAVPWPALAIVPVSLAWCLRRRVLHGRH